MQFNEMYVKIFPKSVETVELSFARPSFDARPGGYGWGLVLQVPVVACAVGQPLDHVCKDFEALEMCLKHVKIKSSKRKHYVHFIQLMKVGEGWIGLRAFLIKFY